MKKILALLLVLCMVFSFTACKKNSGADADGNQDNAAGVVDGEDTEWTYEYVENTGNFNKEELVTGTNPAATNPNILNNNDLINPEKFGGKTLQIYGYASATFEDIDEMGQGSFIWMVRAAVNEWAALNNVKIEYVGDFDENVITGDINSGGKPDLLIYANKFPTPATNGLVRAFTDEEYAELAKTCGSYYLDMMNYKGKSHGVMSPWSGGTLFYYNKTLFEQYGVKSPGEYYMENNWNWDTFEKCITEITKDLDGDGNMDIYGTGTMYILPKVVTLHEGVDGKLSTSIETSQEQKRYLEIMYKATNETKALGAYANCDIATSPRPAVHMGDAEWYNFEHLNKTLVNGDQIEVIAPPKYTNNSESYYAHTPVYSSILTSCDEPEATLALLNYTLRVGMRYMSDFSLGLYKCNYEGIRGASNYAYGWKENFKQIVADRQEKFNELEDWNQELYEKMQNDVLNADHHWFQRYYPGQVASGSEASTLPPASSLPILAQREKTWINEYNAMYAK